jgi:hypothetical protein
MTSPSARFFDHTGADVVRQRVEHLAQSVLVREHLIDLRPVHVLVLHGARAVELHDDMPVFEHVTLGHVDRAVPVRIHQLRDAQVRRVVHVRDRLRRRPVVGRKRDRRQPVAVVPVILSQAHEQFVVLLNQWGAVYLYAVMPMTRPRLPVSRLLRTYGLLQLQTAEAKKRHCQYLRSLLLLSP